MATGWYFNKNGQPYGPVSAPQMQQLVASGQIDRQDLVWQEGYPAWLPVHAVPGLFPAPAAAPPVQPSLLSSPFSQAAAQPAGAGSPSWLDAVNLHCRRAFASDLAVIPVTPHEGTQLATVGITDLTVQRLAVWRRSVLLLVLAATTVTALLKMANQYQSESGDLSPLGTLLTWVDVLAVYALPVSSLAAFLSWLRPRWSERILAAGWAVAFLVPIVTALFPLTWVLRLSDVQDERAFQEKFFEGVGILVGLYYFVMLMPTVLSLIPGLLRACLRLKMLIPASSLPGWLLVAGSPLYLLLWLVTFIAFNHFAGNLLLIVGVMLWFGAPMLYVARADLIVRPLNTAADCHAVGRVQQVVRVVLAVATGLLLLYLTTKTIFGKHILGLDPRTSLMQPWNQHLLQWLLEYLGRSLFVTVVFADLMLRMSLTMWRHQQAFAQTPGAAEYNRLMGNMEGVISRKE
ncbi:hypothetical protein AYO44_17975 [Planctomycetaceae bacterium SCGC AG-212-F19]|nr:hypothetical protein AYO44_17975 [Planctomycetaceae bacterium SCGC AG-212-F19]